jgi:AraC-like DNA-binding protein
MNNDNVFWKVPELDGLELQKATYRNHSFTPHFHEEYALGTFLRGVQKKFYRGSTHTISAGNICVINPGEIHYGYPIDEHGWTYRMIFINAGLMKELATQIMGTKQNSLYFQNFIIDDRELFKKIIILHQTLEFPGISLLEKETKFLCVMGQLILKYTEEPPKSYSLNSSNRHVVMVKDYLNDNYDQDVSLKILSKLTELSPYYLLRLFKKEVGATPHLYLTQRRINKAKQFLISGDSLTEVAHKTGFVDQSHFTHRFKNMVGVTPGQYYSKNLR